MGSILLITAGIPGQLKIDLSTNLETGLGLAHLPGYTCIDTHVSVLIRSSSDESQTSLVQAAFAIGVKPTGMDNGDYPNLELYEGDWLWYQAYQFLLPGAVSTPVLPDAAAFQRSHSGASRRITDIGQEMVLVGQQGTSQNVDYFFQVQQLWLMP